MGMIRFLLLLLLWTTALSGQAQDSLIADTPSPSDSVIFLSHTVVKGETVYGICRQYGISQEELVKFNPILQDGLKIGQVLIVPVYPALDEEPPADDQPVILHRVEAGQTIYSICKKYDISEEELIGANAYLIADGLQPGQLLRIPVQIDPFASAIDPDTVRTVVPIDLDSLKRSDLPLEEEEQLYARSRIGLEFYTGFKMVLDSLTRLGQDVRLDVFDTGGQAGEAMTEWLRFTDWTEYQLIVGPLYTENVRQLAEYFQDQRISTPVLVPYSREASLFYRHGGLVQLTPSDRQMNQELCAQMIRDHGDKDIHVIYTDSTIDAEISSDALNKMYLYKDSASVHLHQLSGASKLDLELLKNTEGDKLIYLATYDKVFVTDLMRRLNGLRLEDIIIYGPQWVHTMDMESVYLNNLHYHFPAAEFCDYSDTTLIPWIVRYRKDYFTDVSRFSLTGIDLARYASEIVSNYTEFRKPSQALNWKGFQTGIQLRELKSGSLINKHVYILRYQDFELIPLTHPGHVQNR
jgi:LysM repeat protein